MRLPSYRYDDADEVTKVDLRPMPMQLRRQADLSLAMAALFGVATGCILTLAMLLILI